MRKTVDEEGRIEIPEWMRVRAGLETGQPVRIEADEDRGVLVVKPMTAEDDSSSD